MYIYQTQQTLASQYKTHELYIGTLYYFVACVVDFQVAYIVLCTSTVHHQYIILYMVNITHVRTYITTLSPDVPMKWKTIKDQVLAQLWPHVHELKVTLIVFVGVQHKVHIGLGRVLWNVCETDIHCFKIPDKWQCAEVWCVGQWLGKPAQQHIKDTV